MNEPITTSTVEAFIKAMTESGMTLAEIEHSIRWAVIRRTYELHNFNACQTAKALGIHRNTLQRHLRKMRLAGITFPPHRRRNSRRGVTSDPARRQRLSA
jgi:DNA-binding NtrC family response regulator